MRELVVVTWQNDIWWAEVFDRAKIRQYFVIGFNKDSEKRRSLNPMSKLETVEKSKVADDFDLSWYVWERFRYIDNDTENSPRYDEILRQMNQEKAEKEAEEKARQERYDEMEREKDPFYDLRKRLRY